MILQTSFPEQIKTISTLTAAIDFEKTRQYESFSDLAAGYRSMLNSLGQRVVDMSASGPRLITDAKEAERLSVFFANDSLLDDKAQAEVISRAQDDQAPEKKRLLSQALLALAAASPEHAALFNLIITDIFVLPSNVAKGGATSQAIGVIWANPKVTYTMSDFVEILIHEMTHHAMFLDELKCGHYAYEKIIDRSTWARSAVLNIARPLDKVLHSIVVALEVVLAREAFLGHPLDPRVHPPTDVLVAQIRDSIASTEESVRGTPAVFNKRASEILENARNIVTSRFAAAGQGASVLQQHMLVE